MIILNRHSLDNFNFWLDNIKFRNKFIFRCFVNNIFWLNIKYCCPFFPVKKKIIALVLPQQPRKVFFIFHPANGINQSWVKQVYMILVYFLNVERLVIQIHRIANRIFRLIR